MRIPWFDYESNAAYYITICTKNRKPYFGKIENVRRQAWRLIILCKIFHCFTWIYRKTGKKNWRHIYSKQQN